MRSAGGVAALAAEVVDEEHARVGLHLQRRLVVGRVAAGAEVEHLQGQLAPGHHHGALAVDPAAVVLDQGRLLGVVQAVEDAHHAPLERERVRDEDPPPDGADDALGHDRLAVAGRAVQEDGAARGDGGAETLEHLGREHQLGERPRQRAEAIFMPVRLCASVWLRYCANGTGAGPR